MPKYVVGCQDGHDFVTKRSFDEFDKFKVWMDEGAWCHKQLGHNVYCPNRVYIKPQTVQFTIQPGFYDDFSTGSVQEKQLRREGYL